ncbi:MAG: FAD-dependent monooxygenase [Myxococcales bacterium]|nr:FAD-dependent monooxygenase [Myxococcales bacterium]
MHSTLRVGVVGAGTAGTAAALFLARAGHEVTLFEAVPAPAAIGAGILLQPTGLSVLARLGLANAILARGARVDRLHAVTHSRRTVLDLSYGRAGADRFGLGLHRGVLFTELLAAARTEPRISVRCGVTIEAQRRDGDGCTLTDGEGGTHGPFDLVVVADGARSRLRSGHVGLRHAKEYPWGALWFIAEDPDESFRGVLFQVVERATTMLGFLPSGFGPEGRVPRVSLFWSVRAQEVETLRAAGLGAWKTRVAELEPRAEPVLAQIEHIEQLLYARYHDIAMRPWHDRGVVFLGDAAHATSPQLGQGANLALVDALVLSECVASHDTLDEGLAAYSRERRTHLAYYQWATRFLTPFFQSGSRTLAVLRDVFMGPLCRMPVLRGLMLRTLIGVERGPFRAALPLPPNALPPPV